MQTLLLVLFLVEAASGAFYPQDKGLVTRATEFQSFPAALVEGWLSVAILVGIVWLIVLRHKVQRQTAVIGDRLHLETTLVERYRDLVENATDLVFTVDVHGLLLTANQAAQHVFGIDTLQARTASVQQFIVAADRDVFKDVLALLIGGERTVLRHVRICTVYDQVRIVELNCRIRHTDGSPGFVEVIGRDVTQQKQEQAALEQARCAAEAASRTKSEFLANMSHEIRTPMNAILGMTEVTLQGSLEADQRSNLEVVRRSAEALVTILNDILEFSRMDIHGMEMQRAPFEILPVVADVLDLVALTAAQKGIPLVCDVDPSLPAEWLGDAARLRQVLTSLVGNASKFTESGEILVRLDRITSHDGSAQVRFLVRDTGVGIPAEQHERIFEMFSQADGSFSRKYGGTGVGLAIASRLVAAMGGKITVHSAPGVGSSFEFTIDLVAADDRPVLRANTHLNTLFALQIQSEWLKEAVTRTLRHAGASAADPQNAHILIAEEIDQAANSRLVAIRHLRQEGAPSTVLRLPLMPNALLTATMSVPPAETAPGSAPGALAAGTILLAEDNKVNQVLAVRALERSGYRVVIANNGREAVDMLRRVNPDLVLMDIQMPEMDGLQATAQIRQWSSVPVIAMTAHALTGDRERCLDGGMNDYISKPVRPSVLLQMVERYITASTNTIESA